MSVSLYIDRMAIEEKRAWIMLVVSVAAYAIYLSTVLSRAGDTPLVDVPYAGALIWTVIGAIVASIVLHIVVAIVSGQGMEKPDARDREIGRFGEAMGQSFVVIGAVSAMLMAMLELPYFWIANVIYLCFLLSSVLGSIARIIAYRSGLPRW